LFHYQYILIAHEVLKKAQAEVYCTLIYSSYCVSNFMLPTFRPNTAEGAHTTHKTSRPAAENEDNHEEEPWSKELVSGPETS
jgi:hypothetical protein